MSQLLARVELLVPHVQTGAAPLVDISETVAAAVSVALGIAKIYNAPDAYPVNGGFDGDRVKFDLLTP